MFVTGASGCQTDGMQVIVLLAWVGTHSKHAWCFFSITQFFIVFILTSASWNLKADLSFKIKLLRAENLGWVLGRGISSSKLFCKIIKFQRTVRKVIFL